MQAFLDHIGIAVKDGSPLAKVLLILGLPVTGQERVEREKVNTHWIPLPQKPANIELLFPTQVDSTIGVFLEKTGKDAIHHLSFRVSDIEKTSLELTQSGFQLVYPQAKEGAHQCLVNFIHPKSTGGVLIELSQKK